MGVCEKAIRAVFEQAQGAAPAVIIFDEIDALTSIRGHHAGASAHSSFVPQLLSVVDKNGTSTGAQGEHIIIINATKRPDLLGPTLSRTGPLDV